MKHGSKPRRDKRYQPRLAKRDCAYRVIRDNWRTMFVAAQVGGDTGVWGAKLEVAKQADVLSAFAEVTRRIDANQVYKEAA